jgi:ferredoxin-NADP reductase
VRVARRTVEAEDVVGFRLVAADGARLPAFAPGAHIDVSLPGGLVRQYSLCNASVQDAHYEIGVLRDACSRGGSLALHDAVHEGAVLRIGVPRNHFPLDESATRSLLLAGGIGVTPLLSMAQRLAALRADFALHCCSRTAARAPYRRRLEASAFAHRVFFHHDDGPGRAAHGPGRDHRPARRQASTCTRAALKVFSMRCARPRGACNGRTHRCTSSTSAARCRRSRLTAEAPSRSSCAARDASFACPRRSAWRTRWRQRASTFRCRAHKACAALASRA